MSDSIPNLASMLAPHDNYYGLKLEVHCAQARASYHWNTLFMLDFTTVVPGFAAYHDTWTDAGYTSPFSFDWLGFDETNRLHVRYLEVVIETLDEQGLFWQTDQLTKASTIFSLFHEFIECLRRLYGIASGNAAVLLKGFDNGVARFGEKDDVSDLSISTGEVTVKN